MYYNLCLIYEMAKGPSKWKKEWRPLHSRQMLISRVYNIHYNFALFLYKLQISHYIYIYNDPRLVSCPNVLPPYCIEEWNNSLTACHLLSFLSISPWAQPRSGQLLFWPPMRQVNRQCTCQRKPLLMIKTILTSLTNNDLCGIIKLL